MFNLELISELNGWNFAVSGILIVFLSLSGLAFIISCFHKLLACHDRVVDGMNATKTRIKTVFAKGFNHKRRISSGLREYAKKLKTITALTGEPFHLSDLIDSAEKRGLISPAPGFIVDELLKANFIVKDDAKRFRWNHRLCNLFL